MTESNNKTLNAVFEAALQLSAEEREKLVALLNEQSAAEDSEANCNAAWVVELRRRVELLRSGQMPVVAADEAIQRARARLIANCK